MLSPLRAERARATAREPPPRDLGGPGLSVRRRVGDRLLRVDPTRPDRRRSTAARAMDHPPVAGPRMGPEARDPPRPRAGTGGGARARGRATGARDPDGLLEGLSVPREGRRRATPVRLLAPDPSFAHVLRRRGVRDEPVMPRLLPGPAGPDPTTTLTVHGPPSPAQGDPPQRPGRAGAYPRSTRAMPAGPYRSPATSRDGTARSTCSRSERVRSRSTAATFSSR